MSHKYKQSYNFPSSFSCNIVNDVGDDVSDAIVNDEIADDFGQDFADDFDKTGLTWSVFRSVKEALNVDPDLTEDNPLFKKILHPNAGEFLVPRHPANFSKVENSDATPAPALGEHTEEVLGDVLNLSDLEISNLFDDGVVASPNYNKN